MEILSPTQKYSVDEIAKALNLTTKLKHGIRQNFGDPISINDLLQIDRTTFLACKNLGLKSWCQFHTALSVFYVSESAVTLIDKTTFDNIIVKIDISRSFQEVILDLSPTTTHALNHLQPVFSFCATGRSDDFDSESTPPVQ